MLCIINIIVFSLIPWLRHYTSPDNTIGEQFSQEKTKIEWYSISYQSRTSELL